MLSRGDAGISALLVGILLLIILNLHPTSAQTEGLPPDNVLLTLTSQAVGSAPDQWCRFSVDLSGNDGGMSERCGPGTPASTGWTVGVPIQSTRSRSLTEAERATVRRLYTSARVFDGNHVGAARSGSDLPFFMLIVQSGRGSGPAVALVVSGNPSFSSGPRKALLDWLLQERQKLLKSEASEK